MLKGITCATMAMLMAGCISKADLSAPATGAAAAMPLLDSANAAARTVYEEALIAGETYRYVSGELTIPLAPNGKCSTALNKELNEFERRKHAFTIQQAYLKSIVDKLNAPLAVEAYSTGLFTAVDGLNGLAGSPVNNAQIAAAKALADAAINIARLVRDENSRRIIVKEAREKHKALKLVTEDLGSSISSTNKEVMANIKLFEQCEYEKLIYIRDAADTDRIQLEKRYTEFLKKKLAFKGYLSSDAKVQKVLSDIVKAHEALFNPRIGSLDDALRELNEAIAAMKDFKARIEAYEAARENVFKPFGG